MKKLALMLVAVLILPNVFGADTDWKPAKPNIVYVLCDDLGYGDVHSLNPERGKIATPNIDRFITQGMSFTDSHSSSAVCSPSRYSILTGRYNWRSRLQKGVLNGDSEPLISNEHLTVAQLLKQQGYATAAMGKWHLGCAFRVRPAHKGKIIDGPLQHGFDHFFGISASLDMPPFKLGFRMIISQKARQPQQRNGFALGRRPRGLRLSMSCRRWSIAPARM